MSVLRGSGLAVQKSKFSVLAIDSSSDDSDDNGDSNWEQVKNVPSKTKPAKSNSIASSSSKAMSKNAKKRARKKKQRELSESSDGKGADPKAEEGVKNGLSWEQEVKMRNQVAADSDFQTDLEKALLMSKVDAQGHAKLVEESRLAERVALNESLSTNKTSTKKKAVTVSLQEFHRGEATESQKSSMQSKDSNVFKDDPVTPTTPTDDFFQRLDASVQQEVRKEEVKARNEKQLDSKQEVSAEDVPRIAQLQDDVEKRDTQIEKLCKHNELLKKALKEVKQRNQSLCKILSQGEFATKTELIEQVDQLTTIKNDLTEEVETLHSSLEQEKSKNKLLKLDLAKHTGGAMKSSKTGNSS